MEYGHIDFGENKIQEALDNGHLSKNLIILNYIWFGNYRPIVKFLIIIWLFSFIR